MNEKETCTYRDGLDNQIKETTKDVEKNISYIIIGALGFFITMLDKFIDARVADYIFLIVISFSCLLLAFILFLYCKHVTIKELAAILKFVDDNLVPKAGDKILEHELITIWKASNDKITRIRKATYILLGIGVVLEVLFFTINILYNNKKESEKPQKVQIEIINKDSLINLKTK